MIAARRSDERHWLERSDREVWLSFDHGDPEDPCRCGIGALLNLRETVLAPNHGARFESLQETASLLYVREGSLAFEDSAGRSGVLGAGEFQSIDGEPGLRRTESNASQAQRTHHFQACFRASGPQRSPVQAAMRFSLAERRRRPCLVASPDGRLGSVRTERDVLIYSALLGPGAHSVHELKFGRIAWVHLVQGEAKLGDVVLSTGDGARVEGERSVSLTARRETELLLFDLAGAEPTARPSAAARAERSTVREPRE